MANQTNGPKVEKVVKGGKAKDAKPGKAVTGQEPAVKVTKTDTSGKGAAKAKAKAEKAEKRTAAKIEKERKKAARAEQKEAAKAEKAQKKAAKTDQKAEGGARAEKKQAAKVEKEQKQADKGAQKTQGLSRAEKREAAKAERAAKKLAKSEKKKAVKAAHEGEEKTPARKKKKIILAAVAIVLALLVAVSVFFLVRMLRGDGEDTKASLPQSIAGVRPVQAGITGGKMEEGEDESAPQSKASQMSDTELEADVSDNGTASSSKAQASVSDEEKLTEDEKKEPEGKESKSGNASEEPSKDESLSSVHETPPASSKEEQTSSEAKKPASAKEENRKPSSKAEQPSGTEAVSAELPPMTSAELAAQAVEGSVGTANVAAMLGSGAVAPDQVDITPETPMDKPKPGQIVGGAVTGGQTNSTASSEPSKPVPEGTRGTALTPPTKTQEVPDFQFSEASLNLPPYIYNASGALEAQVHRDIGDYLDKKDDRPGVQITSVVIGGRYTLPDGSLRVLAYAWGSRYAIADNTLFDYGSLVGPCALDYRNGTLQKITLARAGDQFESSVREFCGDLTDVADRMVNQSYDLELRGQMLRNVSNYIRQNNIPVLFFRASGQVYNKDGTIYLSPEMQQDEESQAPADSSAPEETLQDQYRVIQDMPE